MKILIADDEPLARLRLRALITELGDHEILDAEATNGKEALDMARAYTPDILMLDIGMPGVNGMEAAQRLHELAQPPAVIFTTAYSEYALEAFEHQAVDYLLKPIRKDRLKQALQRAHSLLTAAEPQAMPLSQEGEAASARPARTHIGVTLHGEVRLIPVDKIYFFRAEQKYVTLRWTGGEALLDEPLKNLEQEFGGQFLRIHRNALVAVVYLSGWKKEANGQCYVSFSDIKDRLEVSRRHLQSVKQTIKDISLKPREITPSIQ